MKTQKLKNKKSDARDAKKRKAMEEEKSLSGEDVDKDDYDYDDESNEEDSEMDGFIVGDEEAEEEILQAQELANEERRK